MIFNERYETNNEVVLQIHVRFHQRAEHGLLHEGWVVGEILNKHCGDFYVEVVGGTCLVTKFVDVFISFAHEKYMKLRAVEFRCDKIIQKFLLFGFRKTCLACWLSSLPLTSFGCL